jgi:hypothetical protein
MSYGQLGARIDTSGGVDSFGFVPGAPHEDALTISAAVSALDDVTYTSDEDVCAFFGDLLHIAGDAFGALKAANFDARSLVIAKAISGHRPPWQFDHPTPYQMKYEFRDEADAVRERATVYGTDANGFTVMLTPNRGRAAMRDGLYNFDASPRSPLNWNDPSPLHVAHSRAEYFTWHRALVHLASTLNGKLKEYWAEQPAAKPVPWLTGQAKPSRVLSDGLPAGVMTATLPLRPKRRAPSRPLSLHERARNAREKGVSLRFCPTS